MMKLIYKPFGIVVGMVAGLISSKLFEAVWGVIDEEEPPTATTRDTSWAKVVGSAAVSGMTFSVVRAVVNRGGAKGFEHLTGAWPGPKQTEKSQAAEAVR
jgi:hypothetical protein